MGRKNTSQTSPKHILLVDDHPLFRQAISFILKQKLDNPNILEADNSNAAYDLLIKQEHWDLVVLDLSMPGRDGLDLLKDIKRECPNAPVLILTAHPAKEFAVRCIRSGAQGYLDKQSNTEEIANALLALLNGGKYITGDVADELANHLASGAGSEGAHTKLSNREFQILRSIAEGHTVSEVANALSLSTKTVSTYRNRLLKKLNLENNAQIMQYAIKNNLVE